MATYKMQVDKSDGRSSVTVHQYVGFKSHKLATIRWRGNSTGYLLTITPPDPRAGRQQSEHSHYNGALTALVNYLANPD